MHRNLASISVTHSFSVISANIAINISLKNYNLWPTFPPQKVLVYLQPLLRNPSEFDETMVRLGYYAIQGHSRSPILVPIESSYATSY